MRPNIKFGCESDPYSQLYFRKDDVVDLLSVKADCILLVGFDQKTVCESSVLFKVFKAIKDRQDDAPTVIEIKDRGEEFVLGKSIRIQAEPLDALNSLRFT